jgi:hypothetical protein
LTGISLPNKVAIPGSFLNIEAVDQWHFLFAGKQDWYQWQMAGSMLATAGWLPENNCDIYQVDFDLNYCAIERVQDGHLMDA